MLPLCIKKFHILIIPAVLSLLGFVLIGSQYLYTSNFPLFYRWWFKYRDSEFNWTPLEGIVDWSEYQNGSDALRLFGEVWPRPANETNARIESQIRFIKTYMPSYLKAVKLGNDGEGRSESDAMVDMRMKVIVRIGKFNFEGWKDGQAMFKEQRCPIDQCFFSTNPLDIYTADALLISELDSSTLADLLPKPSHQIWIAQHYESPPHTHFMRTDLLKNLVNWTASFRRDSTIVIRYGHYESLNTTSTHTNSTFNYAKGKTKQVSMLVSNCNPVNNRMKYAYELQKYIPVDIYGSCGTYSCPKHLPSGRAPCIKWLATVYKFYLAFENSNCQDYITEKLHHNALSNNILPVVLGASREDYTMSGAPPHSYIHVNEFDSPRSLAAYLNYLDHNDTAYNEYFQWKDHWMLSNIQYHCRLCSLLHLRKEVGYVHWYPDYGRWWNDVCSREAGYSTRNRS